MKQIQGNLIELAQNGTFDVVIHGCNCFNTMGAGLAKQVKNNFPEAYEADLQTVKGDKSKLGTYSFASISSYEKPFIIVNAYTQYNWRGRGTKADYDAIKKVFKQINADFVGKHIGIPLIGAGLAGGDWEKIKQIIETESSNVNLTLVTYTP